MNRVALTDGNGLWFDRDKAVEFEEETYFNGNNHISKATGSQWEHQMLFLTASGKWVLKSYSQMQGTPDSIEEITAEDAARWFARQGMKPPDELEREVELLEI